MAENKTEQAKQLLVRYIHDTQMERGEKLPGQDYFRRKFNYGTTTIGAAIKQLQKDGVLKVKDKIGAYLLNPNANGHISRTIALTAVHLEDSMFYSTVASFLLTKLMERGCLMRLFYCENPGVKLECSLDDFQGLRRCIDNGEIQGIIHIDDFCKETESFLHENHIPSISLGGGNTASAKCGIFINQLGTMLKGAKILRDIGIKRPAVMLNKTLYKHFKKEFELIISDTWGSLPPNSFYYAYNEYGGRNIAWDYINLPQNQRPDGMIILDDIVGGAFTSELAIHLNKEELPLCVVMRNKQMNIPFSLPKVVYFDVDLAAFSEKAVNIIFKAIKCNIMDSGYNVFDPELNLKESTIRLN